MLGKKNNRPKDKLTFDPRDFSPQVDFVWSLLGKIHITFVENNEYFKVGAPPPIFITIWMQEVVFTTSNTAKNKFFGQL